MADFLELDAVLNDHGVVKGLDAIDRAQKNVAKSGIVLTDAWGNVDKALVRSRSALVQTEQASTRVTQTLSQMFAGAGGSSPSAGAAMLTRSIGALGGAFGVTALTGATVAFTVARITQEAIASASRISDLAAKTDLSTDAVQRLGFIAEQTGTSVETMASSAFRLGLRLSSGGSSVTKAVNELGLSLQQIRALNPEAQFDAVARALSKITDTQQRNRIGVQIFGRQYEQIAPAIKEYSKLIDNASVASAENIAALDRLGDRITGFSSRVKAAAIDAAGTVVRLAEEAARLPGNAAAAAGAARGGAINSIFRLGQAGGALPTTPIAPGVTKQAADYVKELEEASRTLNEKLTPATVAQIQAAKTLGATTDELMQEFHLGEKEALLLDARLEELKKTSEDATRSFEANRKASAEWLRQFEIDLRLARIRQEELSKATERYTVVAEVAAETGDFWELMNRRRTTTPGFTGFLPGVQQFLPGVDRSMEAFINSIRVVNAETGNWRDSLDAVANQFQRLAQIGGPSVADLTRGIGGMVSAISAADAAIKQLHTSTTLLGRISGGLGLALLPLQMASLFHDDPIIAQVRALEAEARKLDLTFERIKDHFNKGGKDAWLRQAESLQKMIDGLHAAEEATRVLGDVIREATFAADQAGRTGIEAVLAELEYQRQREIDALAQYAATDAALYMQAVEAVTRKYTALADRAVRDEADRMAKESQQAVDELTRVSTLLDTIKAHTDTEIASLGQFSSAGEFYRAVIERIRGRQMSAELSALRRAGQAVAPAASDGGVSMPVSIGEVIVNIEQNDPFAAERIGRQILDDISRKGQRVS